MSSLWRFFGHVLVVIMCILSFVANSANAQSRGHGPIWRRPRFPSPKSSTLSSTFSKGLDNVMRTKDTSKQQGLPPNIMSAQKTVKSSLEDVTGGSRSIMGTKKNILGLSTKVNIDKVLNAQKSVGTVMSK